MLFNSWQFAVFFPVVWILQRFIKGNARKWLLLAASILFYMFWDAKMVLLLLFTTFVNYFCAIGIEKASSPRTKKLFLALGLCAGLGILFTFKYLNFFASSLGFDITLNLILPMGISFYTFQTIGYTIDVYRGTYAAERDPVWFCLYVSFFPQLVAGPIERADRLLPQLKASSRPDADTLWSGICLMAVGFFKKLVVADTLAKGVNLVYNNLGDYTGLTLVMATVMFAFQIYCDFSGYSDIARGCARTMGVELMHNFDAPYLSRPVREFWRRWHISLSTWFRDYVYIPLGGKNRRALNTMITFILSGLWHGANWTFVVWGALNGAYQVIESAIRKKPRAWLGIPVTFVLVTFAWLFFRANTLGDAWYVVTHMFSGITSPLSYLKAGIASLDLTYAGAGILAAEMAILFAIDLRVDKRLPERIRPFFTMLLIAVTVILATKGAGSAFIYFQF